MQDERGFRGVKETQLRSYFLLSAEYSSPANHFMSMRKENGVMGRFHYKKNIIVFVRITLCKSLMRMKNYEKKQFKRKLRDG